MRPAEQQSALEALTRTDGWALVVEQLERIQREMVTKLTAITGPAGASEAPILAARHKVAKHIAEWPQTQIESIQRQLEQGERDAR